MSSIPSTTITTYHPPSFHKIAHDMNKLCNLESQMCILAGKIIYVKAKFKNPIDVDISIRKINDMPIFLSYCMSSNPQKPRNKSFLFHIPFFMELDKITLQFSDHNKSPEAKASDRFLLNLTSYINRFKYYDNTITPSRSPYDGFAIDMSKNPILDSHLSLLTGKVVLVKAKFDHPIDAALFVLKKQNESLPTELPIKYFLSDTPQKPNTKNYLFTIQPDLAKDCIFIGFLDKQTQSLVTTNPPKVNLSQYGHIVRLKMTVITTGN